MMRLPYFRYLAPGELETAVRVLAEEGPDIMPMAGGTDLLPNMKRRQQTPAVILGLRNIKEMKQTSNGSGLTLGAGLTLTQVVRDDAVKRNYTGLWLAAVQVATPHLRNMGTLGGNICLDTRCSYYDQNLGWRKAINYCMKKEGEVCWVSTGSKRCLALSSTDTAPALIALGAEVTLVSSKGERTVAMADLYQDDGIDFIKRRRDEILTKVILPDGDCWSSTYWKLRRRGSFDFPILSVAAAVRMDGNTVTDARMVLGAVASEPVVVDEAAKSLVGNPLTDEAITNAVQLAAKSARPVKNADYSPPWRRRMAGKIAEYALKELRGDDMREQRFKIARHELI
jgi:4-hydroxybenzoyl-CoA reductase subunit beta